MYKSPIDVIADQLRIQYEDGVLKAVQNYDINVDKEELLKALQYDREQYEKGFADGTRAIARILERLEEIEKASWDEIYDVVHTIIEIIKEEVNWYGR